MAPRFVDVGRHSPERPGVTAPTKCARGGLLHAARPRAWPYEAPRLPRGASCCPEDLAGLVGNREAGAVVRLRRREPPEDGRQDAPVTEVLDLDRPVQAGDQPGPVRRPPRLPRGG